MQEFSIANRLEVVQDLVGYMLGGAWGFLGAVAVLAFVFAVVRTAVMGNASDPIAWGLRLVLVVAVLGSYRPIVSTMISASDDLVGYFMQRAGWSEFSEHISEQFVPMFEDQRVAAGEQPGIIDRVLGMMRGGLLTAATAVTYYLVFVVYDTLRDLTAVIAGLLVVAGPLLVAAGVIGDGKTLKQWFGSLVQVVLWPVLPPFMMMVIVGTSGLAAQTGNVAYVIQQNLALMLLTLITPLVVAFLLGRGGVATLAAAVTGATVGLILGGVKLAAAPIEDKVKERAREKKNGGAQERRHRQQPDAGRSPQRRPGDVPPDDGGAGGGASGRRRPAGSQQRRSRRPPDPRTQLPQDMAHPRPGPPPLPQQGPGAPPLVVAPVASPRPERADAVGIADNVERPRAPRSGKAGAGRVNRDRRDPAERPARRPGDAAEAPSPRDEREVAPAPKRGKRGGSRRSGGPR